MESLKRLFDTLSISRLVVDEVTTIQLWLNPGAAVTLSRNNVDYIVTEYGIAFMKGRTIRERVENLIAVAHPDRGIYYWEKI